MEKCRICLYNRKRMHSLYDSIAEGSISFAELVTSIANVKVLNNDGLPNQACQGCCNKLKDIYDIKCQIERSDIELQKTVHVNRILFTDIKDIKCKLDIKETRKNSVSHDTVTDNFVKSCEKSLEYKNTVIKRLASADSYNKKTLSVKEFLESIKEDPQNEFDIIYDVAVDYEPESDAADELCEVDDFSATSDEEYTPIKFTKKKKKLTKIGVPRKSDTKIICKPVYLSDIRMVRTEFPKKRRTKKCKPVVRADMCPQCGKMVKHLKTHILSHSGVKNFKCEKCSKSFYVQTSLKVHEMTHGDRTFKCDKCVAVFHVAASLKTHQMMHSDDKKFSCETCGKAFKKRGHLLRHNRGVHLGQKNFICDHDQCSKSFQTKLNLKHHMRVHTGERPYKCEICAQPYSYRHDFTRHCLKKHGVFLKGRKLCILNEETLEQERIVMRDMVLRINGIIKDDKPINPFEGPHAVKAFALALKALEAKQIDVEV